MLTRASGQADEMASFFEALGAEVIRCPTIEFAPPDDWVPLDDAIARIRSYDLIVFTSANGVRFFLQRLAERHPSGSQVVDEMTCCAIGPATAAALETAGVRVDIVAADSKAEGALAAIVGRLGGTAALRGLRVLIPRAAVARDLLPDELRRLGARVDAPAAYKTIRPPHVDGKEIANLFRKKTIDAVALTSSSTVSNLAALVGVESLENLLRGVVVGCIGPITAAKAAEYGLKDVVQPQAYTSVALARAIADALLQPVR